MKYLEQRKYDLFDRIATAIFFSILWGLFGTGNTGVFGEIIFNLILVFCAEFSFEYYQNKLCIRSAGKRWVLDGWLRLLIWPFAKPLSWLGVTNCPILAYMMTGFFIYMIIRGIPVLHVLVHVALLWYLYDMRKTVK